MLVLRRSLAQRSLAPVLAAGALLFGLVACGGPRPGGTPNPNQAAPTVSSVTTGQESNAAATTQGIVVSFTKPIDEASVTQGCIEVTDDNGTVPGTVVPRGNREIFFRFSAPMVQNRVYDVEVGGITSGGTAMTDTHTTTVRGS